VNGDACVPRIASPFTRIHSPMRRRRSTDSAGIVPSPFGPTLSRKFPPFDAMSQSIRIMTCALFQLPSDALYPQVSFMVMHVSQSLPGMPFGGIVCSGVP